MSNNINTVNAEAFRNAVFFSLSLRRWGNRVKIKDEAKLLDYLTQLNAKDGEPITAKAIEGNGNTTKITSTTVGLIKSENLDALNEFLNATKESLCGRFGKASPSKIKEGLFVVSKALVQEFEDDLNGALKELREKYIPEFLDDYNPAKERARTIEVKKGGLGPLYDENNYPMSGDLATMFGLEWQWLALGVPDDLPAALRAQAAEKLEKQFTDAAEEVKSALRASFQELIAHAVDKLTPDSDGKTKTYRDSLINNVQAFLDVFEDRNIMSDTALQELVSKAQEVMIGIDPTEIRKDAEMRDTALEGFTKIKASLDDMIDKEKSRTIVLE